MKIVINNCYGGFGLSKKALKYLNIEDDFYIERTDERLIKCVEELGDEASDVCASLIVIEIPDNVDYYIWEYDGIESVHEQHRSWSAD